MEYKESLINALSLSKVKGVGNRTLNHLILNQKLDWVYTASKRDLLTYFRKIDIVQSILNKEGQAHAKEELETCYKKDVKALLLSNENYPAKLKMCIDAPSFFFYKGTIDIQLKDKVIAIVGTRKPDEYAEKLIHNLLDELRDLNPVIVSGLAYGVDTLVHRIALEKNLRTIGVLGSGFKHFYPKSNLKLASRMLEQGGGLISEYFMNTYPDRENFPKRNRIVAGLADCVVVVQSAAKGGSLLTADLANGYHREVFTFPGSIFSEVYKGTHKLIKEHKAVLIENGNDIREAMGWFEPKIKNHQIELFHNLEDIEKTVVCKIQEHNKVHLDVLLSELKMTSTQLNTTLLVLEMKRIIRLLPGKIYTV